MRLLVAPRRQWGVRRWPFASRPLGIFLGGLLGAVNVGCSCQDECVTGRDCPPQTECAVGLFFPGTYCEPIGCRKDDECGAGSVCVRFESQRLPQCTPGCRSNAECQAEEFCPTTACSGFVCDGGTRPLACLPGCHDDGECAVGEVCRVGKCEPGCRDDRGCAVGEVCTGGKCGVRPPPPPAACWPTSPTCYSDPTKGSTSPGAECLATQDNSGREHIQLRQQWIRATTPAGNTAGLVYAVLAGRTQLPWKMCNQSGGIGSGGYIQLIDFFLGGDKATHYSIVGFAKYVPGPATPMDPTFIPAVVKEGFCYGSEDYVGKPAANGIDYSLSGAGVGGGANYPSGLQKPMGLKDGPWKIGPTKAKRIDADFDIGSDAARTPAEETTRRDLLAKLASTGEYGSAGFGGVFFFDDATGTAHGYAALGWVVLYDATGATHIAIPVREVETRSKFNDPTKPNCVGAYRADALDPATCVAGQDPLNPGWGGGNCMATTGNAACGPGESAASTKGYFLITELEQIYSREFQNTLCVVSPGVDSATSKPRVDAQGFYDAARSSCKTTKWNPAAADGSGLPKGDWCAATNGPATATCHDAWRTISFHAFAGAKIQLDSTGAPATCSF